MVKTLSLPRVDTSPSRGPWVTCLPKVSCSPGIVLLGFVRGFESRVPLSLSPGAGMQSAVPTEPSKPLPHIILSRLKCLSVVQPYGQRHSTSGDNVFQECLFLLIPGAQLLLTRRRGLLFLLGSKSVLSWSAGGH